MILIVRNVSLWLSAIILTVLPCLVALDYGGVLPWTRWAAGVAILVAAAFALPALSDREIQGGVRVHWLALVVLAWAVFGWFQTVTLPDGIVGLLSPGSSEAYHNWGSAVISSGESTSAHAISIDPTSTRHVVAVMLLLVTLAWTSAMVFQSRARLAMMLVGLAAGAAIHAGLGIFGLVTPEASVFGLELAANHTNSFAAFINRNNAALLLNIGVGASLGLLAWRLSALIGQEIDDENFELNDLVSLVSDRESSVALLSLVLCVSALLVCGSRGGLVAAMIGFMLAFGWIRARRGVLSIPVVLAVLSICTALLLVPLSLDLKSIQRFDFFADHDNTTLLNDGRLPHWADGWQAAKAYLPLGSGFGTYADAHLPYLDKSSSGWFHHADNLWLEMFTEQGIVGVLFVLLIISGLIFALTKLHNSPDAVDHGLRVAGWYVLAVVLISQIFDFGLISAANLIATGILLTVAATRWSIVPAIQTNETPANSRLDGDDLGESSEKTKARKRPKIQFQSSRTLTPAILIAAIAIIPSFWACRVLSNDAKTDAAARLARFALKDRTVDIAALEKSVRELEQLAQSTPSPTAYHTLRELHHRIARLEEVTRARPRTVEQVRELYQLTAPTVRRLRWRSTRVASDPLLSPHYQTALDYGDKELRIRPLSREARTSAIYLDFVNRDPILNKNVLQQLLALYKTNATVMQKLGRLALDSGERDLTVQYFHAVLQREPAKTASVLKLLESDSDILTAEVVPPTSPNYRAAAKYLITRPNPDKEFLELAYASLGCDTSKTVAERAHCEELSADTAYALGKYQEAFETYELAVRYNPKNASLRMKFISRLRDQGERQQALSQARKARLEIPEDERFSKVIADIGQAELRDLQNPDRDPDAAGRS